eukprot:GHRR01025272.1.p1 GENE.GHRR01025272.1~~GHRR01025272.1.p1  ORF type:complete len:274 (+),score=127.25 GHRR01025272.1:346-1167(+)
MASAANKDEFFARRMQENSSKPDHLPPNQGGKYVGFGSTQPPRSPTPTHGVDDVTALLSKGLSSLGQVAGVAANTATTAVQAGTQNLNHLLQEKQVAQTLQQTSKVMAEKAQVGWLGLKSLYANVASTVESAAKESGYNISLGSKAVATSLQQQQFQQQLQRSQGAGYGGTMHKSSSEGHAFGSQQPGGWGSSSSPTGAGGYRGSAGHTSSNSRSNNSGFAGFDDGADSGWDEWSAAPKQSGASHQRPMQHSVSSPTLQQQQQKQDEDDWGKW